MSQPNPAASEDGPRAGFTALIADDDEDMRHLIATAFRRAGFVVHEASNGNELLDSYAEHATPSTVVVSDIGMPECGGLEATVALKRQSPFATVVLVTAFANPALLLQAHQAGAARVFSKPLNMAALVRAVRSLLVHQ
jgi:CheY-like chemotaxis protein